MRKVTLLIFTLLAVFSCKKEEISSITPKLKNCRVEYLFFNDDITMSGSQSIAIPPDNSQSPVCSYLYNDDKMIKLTGGFISVPLSGQIFSKDVYDSIYTTGRAIYVYTKYAVNDSLWEDRFNPIVYNLDSHKKLVKITKKDGSHSGEFDLNYTYSENQITETFSDGRVRRKFYFEKNNLIKVVSEVLDFQGLVFSKKEILFEEFDDKPNPFKNMYFVKGAFFRAFSDNNYKSFTIKEYIRSSDGTFDLKSSYWYQMPFLYNTDGYPVFGDYDQKNLLFTSGTS
jgi:hypothetical protein